MPPKTKRPSSEGQTSSAPPPATSQQSAHQKGSVRRPSGEGGSSKFKASTSADVPPASFQPREKRGALLPGSAIGSTPFQLGKPKPPPPPKPTPAEVRVAKMSEALSHLCKTFEELAYEQRDEERRLERVTRVIPERLKALDTETAEAKEALRLSLLQQKRAEEASNAASAGQRGQRGNVSVASGKSSEDYAAFSQSTTQASNALTEDTKNQLLLRELAKEKSDLEKELAENHNILDELRPTADESRMADRWNREAVDYLSCMLSCSARKVRTKAAQTLTVMAECSKESQRHITSCGRTEMRNVEGIAPKLIHLLRTGALEAVETCCVVTTDNPSASDMIREYGGILLLAGFIGMGDKQPIIGLEEPEATTGPVLSEPAEKWGIGIDEESLLARPTTVPVASKSLAVRTLRNVATSSDANLEHITSQKTVIPELVMLMTKMNEQADNASSQGSSNGSKEGESRESRRNKVNQALKERMEIELKDRKQLAKENRALAESAGEMLHALITEGKTSVKKIIISAIIQQVQQPGSVPPEDVPALMAILRSTALEQLSLVQGGHDESALNAALGFGRWIKLPTLMLGEARNAFKAAQDTQKKKRMQHARRYQLGLESSPDLVVEDDNAAELHFKPSHDELEEPANGEAPVATSKQVLQSEEGVKSDQSKEDRGRRLRSQRGGSTAKGKSGTARRRESKQQESERDKLRKLRSAQESARNKLVMSREAQRKKLSSLSHSKADDYAAAEAQIQMELGPLAAKQQLMFERETHTRMEDRFTPALSGAGGLGLGPIDENLWVSGESRTLAEIRSAAAHVVRSTSAGSPQRNASKSRLQSFAVPNHMLRSERSPLVADIRASPAPPASGNMSISESRGAAVTSSLRSSHSPPRAEQNWQAARAMLNPLARQLIERTTAQRSPGGELRPQARPISMQSRSAFIDANGWSPLWGLAPHNGQ